MDQQEPEHAKQRASTKLPARLSGPLVRASAYEQGGTGPPRSLQFHNSIEFDSRLFAGVRQNSCQTPPVRPALNASARIPQASGQLSVLMIDYVVHSHQTFLFPNCLADRSDGPVENKRATIEAWRIKNGKKSYSKSVAKPSNPQQS